MIASRMHRSVLPAVIVFVSLAGLARAATVLDPPDFPDTPAGRVATAFFEAFNTGEVAPLAAFETRFRSAAKLEERSAEDRAQGLNDAFGTMGALQPHSILDETEFSLAVLAQPAKLPIWLQCIFLMEEESPDRLKSLEIRPTAAPSDPGASQWWTNEWDDLAQLLEHARQGTDAPAIAAVVMRGGKIIDQAAVGVREAGTENPVTIEDRFHVGSITKSMTATMIARLIERGLLDWDTTLAEALTDVKMRPEYAAVSIQQLLQHRAGLPPGVSDDENIYQEDSPESGTLTEQRARFVARALMTEPIGSVGGPSRYSNVGYVVAGAIAERVTGRSWRDLMREEVFAPFHVPSGGFGWPGGDDQTNAKQPVGHVTKDDTYVRAPSDYILGPDIAPAGNVHCTVTDLARYADAHRQGMAGRDGALTAATITRLHTPLVDSGMPYAGGWVIGQQKNADIHWHNGSAETFFAQMEIDPKNETVIVVAMNIGLAGQVITNHIIDAIREKAASDGAE